ncbi:C-type lectin domain family 4 member D-like [Macrobrachium rosenbergii]|uniref:C-type lectin domain family 4 member D-like n=1 Tax=Macrobrachium rosenbergii TaxID=79674 RepID=UPI0034D5FFFD
MKYLLFALPLLVLLLTPAVEMAKVSSTACCPDNFTTLEGRCIFIATDYYFDPSRVPGKNWTRARELCTSMFGEGDLWKADLPIIDVPLLAAFSSHIVQNLPGMTGYIYWVGSEKVNGQWKWIDGTPISNTSYVWHISHPASTLSNGVNGMLVPSGAFNRFYMFEYESPSWGPSYLCEAKKK